MVERGDDPELDTGSAAPFGDERQATLEALRLIVDEARKASEAGDHQRFDELVSRLLETSKQSSPTQEAKPWSASSKDGWRILVAMVLISGLIASVIYAVAQANSGDDGQTTAQYLSLVSGLAGIAIGWLYGDRTASP